MTTDVTSALTALGWRIRTTDEQKAAVEAFQRGWALGEQLHVDGIPGTHTREALRISLDRLHAGKPTASAHYSFDEFACKCNGRYADCRRILVLRELLESLEKYRTLLGHAVTIVSGYRCPSWNKARGGAKNSQHMYGGAADLEYQLLDTRVKGLHAFAGIGRSRSTHKVRHVDRRDASGHNTTGASVTHPTIWDYAN